MIPQRAAHVLATALMAGGLCAQGHRVRGMLADSTTHEPLPFAAIVVQHAMDPAVRHVAESDSSGAFRTPALATGTYVISAQLLGHLPWSTLRTIDRDVDLGTVFLRSNSTLLEAATIEQLQVRAEQKGDTTIFHAGAFQVNPNASAEDLLLKMPGISTDGGEVKAQGERVKRVLVDGEEFFGDDAMITLRNLPAEVIDKVQVFDRLNDQSQFSGFDDGEREKTINLVTKAGKNQGTFGSARAGYGTDDRYAASLSLNRFKGAERITVLGMANNINQQNFTTEDLVGVQGDGGGRGGGRGGQAATSGLLTGARPGINTTANAGLNYSNKFGKDTKLSGSYFHSRQQSRNTTSSDRTTFLSDTAAQYTLSNDDRLGDNYGHRLNLRFEHAFDSLRSIIVTPRLSLQLDRSESRSGSTVSGESGNELSATLNENRSVRDGFDLGNSVLFRMKGRVKGRSFSANLSTAVNRSNAARTLLADNRYTGPPVENDRLDQRSDGANGTQRHGLDLQYTEPIGQRGQLRINAAPSIQLSEADKATRDVVDGAELLNTRLSNKADNTVRTLRGGLAYRLRGGSFNFNLGLDGMGTEMHSEQTWPTSVIVDRRFVNALPNAMFMWRPEKSTRLRLNYRTSTRTPSITQLQNVVDNSDPLKLSTGNLDLEQGYLHTLSLNFNTTDSTRTRPFFAMLSAQAERDRISNVTYAPATDSTLADGTVLPAGAQLDLPMNLQGHFGLRGLVNHGLPLNAIRSNLNLSAGGSVDRSPGAVNGTTSYTWNTNWNIGLSLGSNISRAIDFRLGYAANFNTARNELRPDRDNAYYQGRLTGRLVLTGPKGWVLENEVGHDQYVGLGQGLDRGVLVWNAAVGHRFLKNDAMELRISGYDLLGRNVSIGREVGDTYIRNSVTDMLQRYVLFSVIYDLRAFKGQGKEAPATAP